MSHDHFADRLNDLAQQDNKRVDTKRYHETADRQIETEADLRERLGALFELVTPIINTFRELHIPYAVTRHIAIALRQLEAFEQGFSRILETDNLNDIDIIIPFDPTLIAQLNAALASMPGIEVDRPISTDAEANDWHEHGFTSRAMGRFKINGVTVEIFADFGYIVYPKHTIFKKIDNLINPQKFLAKYFNECVSLDVSGRARKIAGLPNHVISSQLQVNNSLQEIPIILGAGLAETYRQQEAILLQRQDKLSPEDELRLQLISAYKRYARRAIQASEALHRPRY